MPNKLDPLIRVRKHQLDEKQKALSELYRKVEALEAEKKKLIEDRQAEEDNLMNMDVSMLSYFGPYNDAVKEGVEDINEKIKIIDKRIEMARTDIAKAFEDLKKIEITQENRRKEALEVLSKKESQMLDEIALQSFIRKSDES